VKFHTTNLPGVTVVEPTVFEDERGFFFEFYHARKYAKAGIEEAFVQDNHSRSCKGTLRGLHAQSPFPQAKLVRAIEGEIFDVAVDARLGSPTFGQFFSITLSEHNRLELYVPKGLLHGFCVLSDFAQVEYKCTELYHPEAEFSVAWNDPDIAIPWPIDAPVLSGKDGQAPQLREVQDKLLPFAEKR